VETGNVSVNSIGLKSTTISQALAEGWYWLAVITDVACTLTAANAAQSGGISRQSLGVSTFTGNDPVAFIEASSGTTLPSTAGTLTDRAGAAAYVPRIGIQR